MTLHFEPTPMGGLGTTFDVHLGNWTQQCPR